MCRGASEHHGLKLKAESGYGREPYATPSPPASSPPNKQEIVGRHDHLPPPSPHHDPYIGQLTSSSQGHKNALYIAGESSELLMMTSHDEVLILLPSSTSEGLTGRADHHQPPPAPKPADEEGQIIITASSNSCHDGIGRGKRRLPPPTLKPSDEYGQTIITSDDHMNSKYGREDQILPPPSPHHDTPIGQLSINHGAQHLPLQASY
ncbi:hypothetical protein RND71_005370 [Anisodus tanguticus]|uniref:Uncharacterized protein n=1 Tax=Anisodus tanguticus TaxID=243964 RepID=A0AAE1VLF9_9SOLA|nr:hypothetical protein RND71_005370 [Anisodus tanguticus]